MTRRAAVSLRLHALAPGIALVLAGACVAPPASMTTSAGETTTTGTTGLDTEGPPSPTPSAACQLAPIVDHGKFSGTLRGVASDPIGVCGEAGPITYLRVTTALHIDLHVRVETGGFAPRVEITPDECLGGLAVVCGAGGAADLSDLLPGSAWLIGVGAAADDPALAAPPPVDGAVDPMAFVVDIDQVKVLDPGDLCLDDGARCPIGTACVATDDPDDDPELRACTVLAGDTCESASPLVIDALSGAFTLNLDAVHTDAHSSSCAGAGTRDRVLRAELVAPLPADAELILSTKTAGLDLAVRGPTCDAADELACQVGGVDGLTIAIDDPAGLAAAGVAPWIIIESADGVVGAATFEWTVVAK